MVAEVTMIVIDDSEDVPRGSSFFKFQLQAIRLYCRAKIKYNPKNRVGLGFMSRAYSCPCQPTSDIEHFLTDTLENLSYGGPPYLMNGIRSSAFLFLFPPNCDMKKRMLVFTGHLNPDYWMEDLLKVGTGFKDRGIALDVVSFASENPEWVIPKTKCLKRFVAAANKGNNSHFAHVPPDCSDVRDILVSSKILSPSEAVAVPFAEKKNNKKTKTKNLRRNRKKKNHHHSQQVPEQEHPSPPCPPRPSCSPCSPLSWSSFLSSPPPPPSPVILPAHFQVPPQKFKNQLLFGSWMTSQLVEVDILLGNSVEDENILSSKDTGNGASSFQPVDPLRNSANDDTLNASDTSFSGGKQLEDEDFYSSDGYEDHAVHLKEFRDFVLHSGNRK